MSLPNPNHLLDQARTLSRQPSAGARRQTDLRRAVSAVYYALFHAILSECADTIIGSTRRDELAYRLVYRSIAHGQVKSLCEELAKPNVSAKYYGYVPDKMKLGASISSVADAFLSLQGKRHSADYDPQLRLTLSELELTLLEGQAALVDWRTADRKDRERFVHLLLFPPKDSR